MEKILINRSINTAQPAEVKTDPNLDLPDFYIDQNNPKKNRFPGKEKSDDFLSFSKNLDKNFIKSQFRIAKASFIRKKTARNAYALGEIYMLKKIYSTAKTYYKTTIQLDKTFLPAYDKLILIALIENKLSEANHLYKSLLEVSDYRPDLMHNYALFRVASSAGDKTTLDETLKDLDMILKLQPLDIAAINSYGFILLNFYQKVEEAKSYFEKALVIDPNFVHSLNNLAVCYIQKSDLDKGANLLKKAIKLHPDYAIAYENLAGIFLRKNELNEASNILKQAEKNKVSLSHEMQHLAGWLLILTNKFNEAKNWYENKIMEEPGNNLLYNNLAYSLQKIGDLAEAEKNYRQAMDIVKRRGAQHLAIDDRSLFAFYNLGRLSQFLGKKEDLYKISSDILALRPGNLFGHYLKASALLMDEEYEISKNKLIDLLEKNSLFAEPYQDLSFIYVSIDKNYKATVELVERAINSGIHMHTLYNNLAVAYINLEKYNLAEQALNKISGDREPIAHATRGLLAFRQNDMEKGDKFYRKAVEEIKPSLKNLASQIWLYEQAFYFYRNNNLTEARKKIKESKKLGKSYITNDILNLESKLI